MDSKLENIFSLVRKLQNEEPIDVSEENLIQQIKDIELELDNIKDFAQLDMIEKLFSNQVLVDYGDPIKDSTLDVIRKEFKDTGGNPDINILLSKIEAQDSSMKPMIDSIKSKLVSITGIEPKRCTEKGGREVVVSGNAMDTVTKIKFGDKEVDKSQFSDVVEGSFKVKTPAGSAGECDVVVVNDSGESNKFKFQYDKFEFTSLSPVRGIKPGGTLVTIDGSGLYNTTGVTFDGNNATDLQLADDGRSLTVKTPSSTKNTAIDVVVTGDVALTKAGSFTYVPFAIVAFDFYTDSTYGTKEPSIYTSGNDLYGMVTGTGLGTATKITFVVTRKGSPDMSISIPKSDFVAGTPDTEIKFHFQGFSGTKTKDKTKEIIIEDASGNKTTAFPWVTKLKGGSTHRRTFTVKLRQRGGNPAKQLYLQYLIDTLKQRLMKLRSALPALFTKANATKPSTETKYTDVAKKFISYYIGEINEYDKQLFKYLEQFKLDMEPTLMIYFTMKKQDLIPIIKKYMPAHPFAIMNIIQLKKLSAYEKFKKNYGSPPPQFMGVLI